MPQAVNMYTTNLGFISPPRWAEICLAFHGALPSLPQTLEAVVWGATRPDWKFELLANPLTSQPSNVPKLSKTQAWHDILGRGAKLLTPSVAVKDVLSPSAGWTQIFNDTYPRLTSLIIDIGNESWTQLDSDLQTAILNAISRTWSTLDRLELRTRDFPLSLIAHNSQPEDIMEYLQIDVGEGGIVDEPGPIASVASGGLKVKSITLHCDEAVGLLTDFPGLIDLSYLQHIRIDRFDLKRILPRLQALFTSQKHKFSSLISLSLSPLEWPDSDIPGTFFFLLKCFLSLNIRIQA